MYSPVLMEVLAREHEHELTRERVRLTMIRQTQRAAQSVRPRPGQPSLFQVVLDSVRYALGALRGMAST